MEKIQKIHIGTPLSIEHEGKQVKLIPTIWEQSNHGCSDCFFESHCNMDNGSTYLKDLYDLSCGPEGNYEEESITFIEANGETFITNNLDFLISKKVEYPEASKHISNTLREYLKKSTHGMKLIDFNLFFNDNGDAIHQYSFYLEKPEYTIEEFDKVYNLEEEETILREFAQDVTDGDADHININIITENTIQLTFVI